METCLQNDSLFICNMQWFSAECCFTYNNWVLNVSDDLASLMQLYLEMNLKSIGSLKPLREIRKGEGDVV